MKLLTKDIYETRFPNNSLVKLDEMNYNVKKYYFALYSLYMDLFYQYILSKTNILEYDNKMSNLKSVQKKDMDIYQMFSIDYLKYFYIRSNIYIERLSNDEVEYLSSKIDNRDFKLNDKDKVFIENTFKKLIYENISEEPLLMNYGPNNPNFYRMSNSLIIGFRLDRQIENFDIDLYLKNKELIEIIENKLEEDLTKTLNIQTNVIEYDDNSIRKIDLNEEKKKL